MSITTNSNPAVTANTTNGTAPAKDGKKPTNEAPVFDFDKYDTSPKDGVLTGDEVKAAEDDGFVVWDGFTKNNTASSSRYLNTNNEFGMPDGFEEMSPFQKKVARFFGKLFNW